MPARLGLWENNPSDKVTAGVPLFGCFYVAVKMPDTFAASGFVKNKVFVWQRVMRWARAGFATIFYVMR